MDSSGKQPSYSVSAVIPAYNAGPYIARAIDSTLAQTHPADEIIVVDDGSTDDTASVVKRYGTAVHYISQDHAGASAARNTGIEAAQSEWIAFLDSDDEWLPEYLQEQMALLQRNPKLVWTTANYYRRTQQSQGVIPGVDPNETQMLLGDKEYFESYFFAFCHDAAGCTDTMITRRLILEEAGLFQIGLPRVNDEDMWFRIAYRWPQIGCISKPLAIYHMQAPNSITKSHKDYRIICELVDRHFELATEYGRLEDFKPCAAIMVTWWVRLMLEDKQGRAAREILRKYDDLFADHLKRSFYWKSLFPRASLGYCKMRSIIGKTLSKLRTKVGDTCL